jgi:membrane protease YdiL (CAAX protease family)
LVKIKIVSELNNPFPALQPEPTVADQQNPGPTNLDSPGFDQPNQKPLAEPVPAPINPYAENPLWTALDLLLLMLLLFVAMVLFTAISLGIGALFSPHRVKTLARDPSALMIIPAMAVSYLCVMVFMSVRLARLRQARFWQAISWRWPEGNRWLGFMLLGGVTAIASGLLSRLLPMPKSLPVDRFFIDRRSTYLMVLFGVVIAPLAEELLFRGFLYPVLDRWLETLFMFPRKLRRGSFWVCAIAGWGYLVHKMPPSSGLLLAGLAAIPVLGIFLARSSKPGGKPALSALLPGISLIAWGLATRSLTNRSSVDATAGLLVLALLLMAIATVRPLTASPAAMVGRTLAIVITSAAFAMMHSDQLGSAWAPLFVLFFVGCVLTITRAVTRAVAPGVLIHAAYNATIFGLLYVATDHFRHLERMTQ